MSVPVCMCERGVEGVRCLCACVLRDVCMCTCIYVCVVHVCEGYTGMRVDVCMCGVCI